MPTCTLVINRKTDSLTAGYTKEDCRFRHNGTDIRLVVHFASRNTAAENVADHGIIKVVAEVARAAEPARMDSSEKRAHGSPRLRSGQEEGSSFVTALHHVV